MKKYRGFLLALMMCLSMVACEEKGSGEGEASYDGEISIADLEGFWYPVEGIGSTISVLTCIYINGTAENWEEYDQYGNPTGYTGDAYTDGTVLTLTDVPLIGDVEIPIGDADILVTDTGETYWIKSAPDFQEKRDLSAFSGRWYYQGYQDSEYATILILNKDGTYIRSDAEEGTYTYQEYDQTVYNGSEGDRGTTVFRQEISLFGGGMDESYYLTSDGQVLVHWSDSVHGDDYYIHEDALGNTQLLTEYLITSKLFLGKTYALQFNRDDTLRCEFLDDGITEARHGTWGLSGNTVTIIWDDGETDEAALSPERVKTLTLSSTGEILKSLF
ncbi:hypothetical protein [Enterocloster citroniae]|uniref:Lipocalin-like domain-containing protein n=2 Tax=Enterocloster citroniae TaxID=358743 RepID=A0ABV2G688_9FIRM|nr:hypothetical protein [Enterocloster citroniae]KMW10076.1 hypothetical protein HMPREF9470_05589 [[Clostridium] citroniae WAL-19142]